MEFGRSGVLNEGMFGDEATALTSIEDGVKLTLMDRWHPCRHGQAEEGRGEVSTMGTCQPTVGKHLTDIAIAWEHLCMLLETGPRSTDPNTHSSMAVTFKDGVILGLCLSLSTTPCFMY
jgi:hypothetical protein